MIWPAFDDALSDNRIKGPPRDLLAYLAKVLDFAEWRRLKLWPVAKELQMKPVTAGRAMKRLIDCGYVRQGPREKQGPRSYRLVFSRGTPIRQAS